VQVLGAAVLFQGPAVLDQLAASGAMIRELKASGMQVPPRVLEEQRALAVAAAAIRGQQQPVSHPRQHDTTFDAAQQDSTSTVQIGTREAAQILGVTSRQVQRLAATLDGRRLANGHLIFDRLAVEAYALAVRDNRRTAA
jgi:hypothetical protein